MQSITFYLKEPRAIGRSVLRYCGGLLSDKLFLECMYYMQTGKRLNLKAPKSFSEKLQWLKLYNRRPEYTMMVDKYAVKDYVAKIIGREHIIPTIGVWDRPEEIAWDELPKQFVLKTTHGGGNKGVIVCTDKEKLDKGATVRKLNSSLKMDLYKTLAEWPYKNVRRRIIAETYLSDGSEAENDSGPHDLIDYKYLCFDGKPLCCMVVSNRRTNKSYDFFDNEWNHLPIRLANFPNAKVKPAKPQNHEAMLSLAAEIAKGHPHLRVDFYDVEGKVYFGEITFFTLSGYNTINPEEWDTKLGSYIHLPKQ